MPRLAQAEKLINVIQELSQVRDLDSIMKIVRTAARNLAEADGATFVLRDGDFCHYADEDSLSPLWKGQKFPIETCISGWAMINSKQVVIEDIYLDERIPHAAYRPTFVQSLAMTPIRQEQSLGAIGTYWAKKYVPPRENLTILQALANAVSVAMVNVSLLNTLEEKVYELEKANRSKDEFLMTVSHELRTPLNIVMGWAQILGTENPSAEELAKGLAMIQKNAAHQVRIVDDLVDSSQIVLGRLRIEKSILDFVPLAIEAVSAFQAAANDKKISLEIDCRMPTALVLGDLARLKQVLSNLVSNALKFTPSGGKISVEISQSGPGVQFRIADTGAGISKEFLPFVYERFRQEDSSLTRRFGGLGLGLAIVRYIVDAHRGTVKAESPGPNQGSTFTVFLPLQKR